MPGIFIGRRRACFIGAAFEQPLDSQSLLSRDQHQFRIQPFGNERERFQPGISPALQTLVLLTSHPDAGLHVLLRQIEEKSSSLDLLEERHGWRCHIRLP